MLFCNIQMCVPVSDNIRMKHVGGGKTYQLEVMIELLPAIDRKKWIRPPISVNFEVHYLLIDAAKYEKMGELAIFFL